MELRSLLWVVALSNALVQEVAAKQLKQQRPASAQTTKAIGELMGDFQWGMNATEVENAVEQQLELEVQAKIRKSQEPWEQQKLRDELEAKRKEIRDSYVKFEGQKTGWDVSFLDKEFDHKNNESMFFRWEQEQRRFFFFHQEKLYKMVIGLSQEKFQGKSFGEFTTLMQERYGKAEPRFVTNAAGEQWADRLVWPRAGVTELDAVDHTAFYGTFILLLYDSREAARVAEGRSANAPARARLDEAIEEALSEAATGATRIDEDVVDRLTGRSAEGVDTATSEEGLAGHSEERAGVKRHSDTRRRKATKTAPPAPAKPNPKPAASDNPLEGLP